MSFMTDAYFCVLTTYLNLPLRISRNKNMFAPFMKIKLIFIANNCDLCATIKARLIRIQTIEISKHFKHCGTSRDHRQSYLKSLFEKIF